MSRIGKLPELYVKNVTKPSHLITAAKQAVHGIVLYSNRNLQTCIQLVVQNCFSICFLSYNIISSLSVTYMFVNVSFAGRATGFLRPFLWIIQGDGRISISGWCAHTEHTTVQTRRRGDVLTTWQTKHGFWQPIGNHYINYKTCERRQSWKQS